MALPRITSLGSAVKTSWAAAAGFTVTLGCAAIVTEPTLAVMVFVPTAVELKVPVITPSVPVVPDGVRVLAVPEAESVTVVPLTAFPEASLTVTTMVETLSPLLAVIGLGDAVTEERLELGAPTVPSAVKVTGFGRMPLPAAVAVSEFGPAVVPRVQDVTAAIPSASVAIAVVGVTVPSFTTTANVTAWSATGLSN